MRTPTLLAIGALALAPGCGDGAAAATATAQTTFERFQDALFARDEAALVRLVTDESRPAVDALTHADLTTRKRLVAVDTTDMRGSFFVHVRDPNDGDASGTYVVVRENGRFVVDLVATAATSAVPTGRGTREFEMRDLTPADHDELRRRQLETPAGQPMR